MLPAVPPPNQGLPGPLENAHERSKVTQRDIAWTPISTDKYQATISVFGFGPDNLKTKISNDNIIIDGSQTIGNFERSFSKTVVLPFRVTDSSKISTGYVNGNMVLTIPNGKPDPTVEISKQA